jgi:hypothetical protein
LDSNGDGALTRKSGNIGTNITGGEAERRTEMSDRRCKLTLQEVTQIRQQYQYGRRPSVIAKEFGVSVHSVWKIAHGLSHKELGTKTSTINNLPSPEKQVK